MTIKKQLVVSSVEDLTKKSKEEILEILAAKSGDLITQVITIAKSKKFLNEAILKLASNKNKEVRNWVITLLPELPRNKETRVLLEELTQDKSLDINVRDAAWTKYNACKFHHKIKEKDLALLKFVRQNICGE